MISMAGNNDQLQAQTPLLFRRNNISDLSACLPGQQEQHQPEPIQYSRYPLNCEGRLPSFYPLSRSVEEAEECFSILLRNHQMEILALQQLRSQNLKDLLQAHSLLNDFQPNFLPAERFPRLDTPQSPVDFIQPQPRFLVDLRNSLLFPGLFGNNINNQKSNVFQSNTPMISQYKQDHQATQDNNRNNYYLQYLREQQRLQEQYASHYFQQVKQEVQQYVDQQQDNSSTRETAMTIKVEHFPDQIKNKNLSPSLKCQNTETQSYPIPSKQHIFHPSQVINQNGNRSNNNEPNLLEEFMAVHNMKTDQFQNRLTGTATTNNSIEVQLKKQLKTANNGKSICNYRLTRHSSSSGSFLSSQDQSLNSIGHLLTYIYSFNQNVLFSKDDNLLEKLFELVGSQVSQSSSLSSSSWKISSIQAGLVNQSIKKPRTCSNSQGEISSEEEGEEEDISSGVSSFLESNIKPNVSQHTILTITETGTFPSAVLFEENEQTDNLIMIQKQSSNPVQKWRKPSIAQISEKNESILEQEDQSGNQRNSNNKDSSSLLRKRRLHSIEEDFKVLSFVDELMQKDTTWADTNQKPDKKYNQHLHHKKDSNSSQTKQHTSSSPLFDANEILKQIYVSPVNASNKELAQDVFKIVSQFKSNHKIYFKKVRSAKEMLKDTKFHNLNKRIMRVLLSILTLSRIEELNVHSAAMSFFKSMSSKLVQSAKKTIRDTLVNDQYSHAHYNTMFLRIDQSNYSQLQESPADIELHQIIYQIDLTQPYYVTQYAIHKANIIKRYIYLILHNTLILNETQNDSDIEAIRSLYIKRVLKGMEKMQSGKIVQRF